VKILLAIDETSSSEDAIREVEERLAAPHTTVLVLHAVAKFVPPTATLWYDGGGSLDAAREQIVSNYQELVEGVTERLTIRGL
jgi:hypothetical protein